MKKVSLADFCTEITKSIEDFEMDSNIKTFSNRRSDEWFKLLGDYLGLTSRKIVFVSDIHESEYHNDEE